MRFDLMGLLYKNGVNEFVYDGKTRVISFNNKDITVVLDQDFKVSLDVIEILEGRLGVKLVSCSSALGVLPENLHVKDKFLMFHFNKKDSVLCEIVKIDMLRAEIIYTINGTYMCFVMKFEDCKYIQLLKNDDLLVENDFVKFKTYTNDILN